MSELCGINFTTCFHIPRAGQHAQPLGRTCPVLWSGCGLAGCPAAGLAWARSCWARLGSVPCSLQVSSGLSSRRPQVYQKFRDSPPLTSPCLYVSS